VPDFMVYLLLYLQIKNTPKNLALNFVRHFQAGEELKVYETRKLQKPNVS